MSRRQRIMKRGPLIAVTLVLAAVSFGVGGVTNTAWAGWFGTFTTGGAVSDTAASIGTQTAPTVTGTAAEVIVSWPAATLGGTTIKSYTVKRYSGGVLQTIGGACAGTVANIGCVEIGVPAGTFTYTVTPFLVGTAWVGAESANSAPVTTSGVASRNSLWFWVTP